MNKTDWRKNWLSSIQELTNLELQKTSWLNFQNANPHYTFIEFLECYFTDLVLGDNYKVALESNFVELQEFEILKNWHNELENYISPNENDYDHISILSDKKWLEIVEKGKVAKSKLAEILNIEERFILSTPPNSSFA